MDLENSIPMVGTMKKPRLRFIGDVHGKIQDYLKLANGAEYTIQVGDMGFHEDYQQINLDDDRHRFIKGNHDDYDAYTSYELGDWGCYDVPNFGRVFFLRGAWSIDNQIRRSMDAARGTKTIWDEEEIPYASLCDALAFYQKEKPDLVVTHEAPSCITREIADPQVARLFGYEDPIRTRTGECLQAMFDSHQPQEWVFGHYHVSWHEFRNGTFFHCLNELETLDYYKKLIPVPKK